MKQLFDYIKKFTPLDKDVIDALSEKVVFEKFHKNEHILSEGEYCSKLYFIKSGMIRTYYLDDGKEITKWLFGENEFDHFPDESPASV